MEMVVDTVHLLGIKTEGRRRQIVLQFTMRHYRDLFWKLTKNSKICRDLGMPFKQDFCKEDREARAAAWPKMEQAMAARKMFYYRGHVGYINGSKVGRYLEGKELMPNQRLRVFGKIFNLSPGPK